MVVGAAKRKELAADLRAIFARQEGGFEHRAFGGREVEGLFEDHPPQSEEWVTGRRYLDMEEF